MTRATHTTRFGFSLVEMLVVVSIIAVVLALSFPMIGAMRRDSSVSAGVNAVAQAASAIRLYATKNVVFPADLLQDNPSIPETLGSQGGLYSGAAAIFTPAGEIRLTRNASGATAKRLIDFNSTSIMTLLERSGPRYGNVQGTFPPRYELNGFSTAGIDVDDIILPSDTGVAGINRVSGGRVSVATPSAPPLLLPPPFAVWFDQNGYMIATGSDPARPGRVNHYQFVYYDGNYDGDIAIIDPGSDRKSVSNYDPNEYNPNHADFNPANWNDVAEKYVLPFEKLEAVVGVYVYSLQAFENAVQDGVIPPWSDDTEADNIDRWNWMKENGQMLMFSKQTGSLMRSRDE